MITIVGCGNANRSDDAVGVEVARRMREHLGPRPDVQVFDCGTAGMEVMFAARGTDHLIIVDASNTGSEPGTIYEVPGDELEQEYTPSLNLHDFRWDHALAAGRQIFAADYPSQVEVFLIEAERLDLGLELSPTVARAADRVVEKLMNRLAGVEHTSVTFKNGTLLISKEIADACFHSHDAVALIEHHEGMLVTPVQADVGGALLKVRNANGDRAVSVQDFLRQHGRDEWLNGTVDAEWRDSLGGLIIHIGGRNGS